MDTEKLLRLIKDLQEDESKIGINATIDEIRASLAKNNTEGFSEAQQQLITLVAKMEEVSMSYSFSITEESILDHVNGSAFFGKGLISKLDNILKSPTFEVVGKIDQYKTDRSVFYQKIQTLSASLSDIGIVEYRPNFSEIGIILPTEQNNANTIAKKIHEFELLIQAVQELVGSDIKEVNITRISNGSLEFFTSQPVEVALIITSILANISTIWDKIATLRTTQSSFAQDSIFSPDAQREMKKIIDKEINSVKKEIESTLPDKIMEKATVNLSVERKNEVRNHIRAKMKLIFAWFEIGIEVDVIPVRVPNSTEDTEATGKNNELAIAVKETNKLLTKIYNLPPEVKQLPFALEPENEE